MPNVNKVMLLGHLGHDPEIRHTPKGTAVAGFRMATTKRWKDADSGEPRERTEWHRVVVFGQQATFLSENAKTGSLVHVEGSLRTRGWTDREGGKRYTTEIVGNQVQLLDKKERPEEGTRLQAATREGTVAKTTEEPPVERTDLEDDIPF